MSLDDQLLTDALSIFADTDGLAETLTYKPFNDDEVSVAAIVWRKPPARISESMVGISYEFEVFIPLDETVGRTSIEKGKDKITIADRVGGTATDRLVAEIISSDAGGWHLGIR